MNAGGGCPRAGRANEEGGGRLDAGCGPMRKGGTLCVRALGAGWETLSRSSPSHAVSMAAAVEAVGDGYVVLAGGLVGPS